MPSVPQTYLTPGEAAAWLTDKGISTSEDTVRRWARAGRVPAVRLPFGRLKIKLQDVEAILSGESAGAA